MNKKRGQGAIEFVVILGVVLFFFVAFFSVIKLNLEKRNLEKERTIAQNIALDIQYEINTAKKSSEGYYREFKVPENILGKDYEVNLSGNRIYVAMENVGISYKVSEASGSVKKGSNIIQNQNGTVYLN
jgi:hypothetical protein